MRKSEGEEEAAASTSSSNREKSLLCEDCNANPSKYKCPCCSFRSCSLNCVKSHKQRTGCTGKRNRTQFVPISQLNDDFLLSDYNLLEETKRIAESAVRLRKKLCPSTGNATHFRLPYYLGSLVRAASNRGTRILFLPNGMTKRGKNRTRYDKRQKTIFWTIEWRFNSTDIVLVDHEVNENTRLSTILENHLQPGPWKHQLQKFCDEKLDNLKLFVRKYHKGATSPFHELNSELPIGRLFSNLVVLEYPVIHVFLPSQTPDFEVIKDANTELKNTRNTDHDIPEGVPLKVEEIDDDDDDDDNLMERQILALMKPSTSNSPFEVHQNMHDATYSTNLMGKLEAGNNSPQSSSKAKETGVLKELEFDFDQDLIDSYSNIMAEINPDDFLDWEGEFSQGVKMEMEERGDLLDAREVFTLVEELEEGEIVE